MNEDNVTHNVYSITQGFEFEIKTQEPGKTDSVRFDREGTGSSWSARSTPKMKLNVRVSQ